MDEGSGLPSNSAGLNFHSLSARTAGEVSEAILRTTTVFSILPISSTLTRGATVPLAMLFAGYCGKATATTSTGCGCKASPCQSSFAESGGRGTSAAGMAAGLNVTTIAVRDRTGFPCNEAGLNCQVLTESIATSVDREHPSQKLPPRN